MLNVYTHAHRWNQWQNECSLSNREQRTANTIQFNHIRTEAIIILNNRNIISNVRYTQIMSVRSSSRDSSTNDDDNDDDAWCRCRFHRRHRRVTFYINWLHNSLSFYSTFSHTLFHSKSSLFLCRIHLALWESGIMNWNWLKHIFTYSFIRWSVLGIKSTR